MSIWSSRAHIGHDVWDDDENPPGEVRSYADGRSSHYPTPDVERPGFVGTAHIPPWCVPGHRGTTADEDMAVGPWLRLCVATWDENWDEPMITKGATVILDPDAARSLAAELLAWADSEHIQPTEAAQ